jgi:hypothetical protein
VKKNLSWGPPFCGSSIIRLATVSNPNRKGL